MGKTGSKNFKKQYYSSTAPPSQGSIRSGQAQGIPAGGMIGGGDDYIQKIGRGKIPWYPGNAGSPSQGADSTFSSYLSRVNKGREEYEVDPMFPEQELEVDNSYEYEEVDPISDRKIPRDFTIMRANESMNTKTLHWADDDARVKSTRYSVQTLFEQRDVQYQDMGDLESSRVKDIVIDVLTDAILALGDTFSADVSGVAVVVPAVAFNLWQLHRSTKTGEELLGDFEVTPSRDLALEMDEVVHDITRDLIDIVQRVVEAIPGPGADEAISFIGGQAMTYAGQQGMKVVSEKYVELLDKLPPMVRSFLNWGPIGGIISSSLDTAGQLRGAVVEWNDMGRPEGGVALVPGQGEPASDQEYTRGDLYQALMTGEDNSSQLAELKSFISEAIFSESVYPDYGSYHPPRPSGYQFRDVPTVISKHEEDQMFDVLDDYDDYSVAYKTSGGTIAYQSRNSLEEAALRRLIKRDLSTLFEESKKK
jgi:hypothetical protein